MAAIVTMDPSYNTQAERVKAFREAGGGTRSTYFLQIKKLAGVKRKRTLPQVVLTSKKPTAQPMLRLLDGTND